MTSRLLAALLLSLCVALSAAGGANASCAAPVPGALPEGDGVFLGSVIEQRTGFDRFVVEEVWRGPDLAPQVWVQTGQAPPRWPWQSQATSSVDAELTRGERYVVGLDGEFQTNSCVVQTAAEADVALVRPDDARPPSAEGATGAEPGRRTWALPAAAVAVGLGAAVALRRRRAGGPQRLSRRG